MIEKQNRIQEEEKAVLIGVVQKDQTEQQVQEYLDELAFLAETAGAVTVKKFVQKLAHPDSRTYVGKGKLQEIATYIQNKEIDLLIFDDELTGAQISNIEKEVKVKTIDRSDLILDIFARRAKTAQAKAQVELAQYQYILPRLRGMWQHLDRIKGGIGMRGGEGETQLEADRRKVQERIDRIREELEVQRASRDIQARRGPRGRRRCRLSACRKEIKGPRPGAGKLGDLGRIAAQTARQILEL